MADSIDPKNPPAGAKKVKSGTQDVFIVDGNKAYDASGNRFSEAVEKMVLNATRNGTKDTDVAGSLTPDGITGTLGQVPEAVAGSWLEPVVKLLPRAGLIALGAALCIVGIVMLISGTKAASIATDLIPVAGKVL